MSKIVLYAHGGSGNHGCEAIVRSTWGMLSEFSEEKILLSSCPEEDIRYGLNGLCRIEKDIQPYSKLSPAFLGAYLALKIKKDYVPLDKMQYRNAFRIVNKGDIALSIGGDNYCYADVEKYIMLHDMMLSRGAKTVLWGCSVEPELTKRSDIAADLARYSLITARETISYEALKKVNPNTVLVADPAFTLETVKLPLPDGFEEGNTVGINVSPLVKGSEQIKGITLSNYRSLMSYILQNTDMKIALVPHVIWEGNDDRLTLAELYREFSDSGRVVMIEDLGCREWKGYIARCRFFVGARTHATIAAYSSGVPTLVVGYSVKSRGIARDLFGTEEGYVLPVQSFHEKNDLTNAFVNLFRQEDKIREHLQNVMPRYIEKAVSAEKYIENLK